MATQTATDNPIYVRLKVSDLIRSQNNVREKHSKDAIARMAHSITERGLINAPCVVRNGEDDDQWKVIAGELRTLGAEKAGLEEIDCRDVSHLDTADQIDLSLSENVDRQRMTEIQIFRAFDQLFKAGRSVDEIASAYEYKPEEVQRFLAIGGLPKKLLTLAENGEIGERALRLFATAPKDVVTKYLKLPAKQRPEHWKLAEYIMGNDGWYDEKYAIFNLDDYDGPRTQDLFDEDQRFLLTDGTQFWLLQHAAIEAKKQEYIDKGWKVNEIEYWSSWGYDRVAKKNGGEVFLAVDTRTGKVDFHVGYKRQAKAGTAPKAKANGKKAERPEISKEFEAYCKMLRHQQVCTELMQNHKAMLVTLFVLLLGQKDNLSFRYETVGVKKQELLDDFHDSKQAKAHNKKRDALFKKIGVDPAKTFDLNEGKIVNTMLKWTPKQIMDALAILLADRWAAVSNFSDTVGNLIELKEVEDWPNTEAFWSGISNKQTLLKIGEELKAGLVESTSTKAIRASLKARAESKEYTPEWLRW